MKKKNTILLLASVVIAAAVLVAVGLFTANVRAQDEENAEPERSTIKAEIDDECKSHPHTFTVPAGKTAKDFKKENFQAGKACHDSGAPENKGFAVRDSKNHPVYMWSQYKDQPPYEKGGPIGGLSLEEGEYTLSVAGGAEAMIEMSYMVE